ncbi:flagellar export protein FliJ [Nitrosomonas supralitoralis]|uniref:Flagellar FliJ protein n=1 Tax=Nitrosomonas supralitoralis TaxID=2116706 RepID=A0A2P7NYZ0_9PROT|nr:flagellar export protein FliJ [Nitrosomonas supralitoralis]PSJ18664.1 flagellar export protein FliJ [Nitrosomonas supralitoralis]
MPTTSSLKILLDLAQLQTDTLARKLGKLNLQQQEAEKKLNLLLQYRHSYQSHLQNSTETGIDHIEWLNFIAFMNKLDAAITEQRQAVLFAQNKKNTGNNEFLFSQKKLKSYDTLSQRKKTEEELIQLKNEQKLQDEFASNSYFRNSHPPKNS